MEILLREWRKTDAPDLERHANDKQVSRFLREIFPYPYSRRDAEGFIRFCRQYDGPNRFFAVELGGEVIGSADVAFQNDVHCRSVRIGYWIGRAVWGRGVGTAVVDRLVQAAFSYPAILRVEAECVADNIGSRRVLEKNGFLKEGTLRHRIYKDGQLLDSCIYSILREEYEARRGG